MTGESVSQPPATDYTHLPSTSPADLMFQFLMNKDSIPTNLMHYSVPLRPLQDSFIQLPALFCTLSVAVTSPTCSTPPVQHGSGATPKSYHPTNQACFLCSCLQESTSSVPVPVPYLHPNQCHISTTPS